MSTVLNDPLRTLAQHMHRYLLDFQQRPSAFGQAESFAKQVEELERQLNSTGTARPSRNYLQEALHLVYMQGPQQALATHLRYVCWALLEPWGQPPRALLGTAKLFPATLAELEKLSGEPVFRPLAWRGLLEAYFQYSPQADATVTSQNWRLLRNFLAQELPRLSQRLNQRSRPLPPWLQMLGEHMNLLGDDPCARYAPAVLAKDEGDIQRLRDELQIPKGSWFWSELWLSQVRRAIKLENDAFRALLDDLLEQLQKYQNVLDTGLALLLERYTQSPFKRVLHTGLRDAAIGAWGSPHFHRNARWGLVKPDTKRMVQKWLVVRALTDFFDLLQEDRAADARRLTFWLRFQDSIDYFHFALGPDVYESQQADYMAIRKSYREQICRLTNPGKPGNNAFILKIEDYFFVEFGAVGNACYGYHKNQLPFELSNLALNLNRDLKVRGNAVLWLKHATNTYESWETKFERELAQLGIYPGQTKPVRVRTRSVPLSQPISSIKEDNHGDSGAQAITLARQAGLSYEDLRHKGGALWISHHRTTGLLAQQLGKLGFRYHDGRGWWRK